MSKHWRQSLAEVIELNPGDRILFVGRRSSYVEEVRRVTACFVFTTTLDPRFIGPDLEVVELRLSRDRISPVPAGVSGVVGCYRRSH